MAVPHSELIEAQGTYVHYILGPPTALHRCADWFLCCQASRIQCDSYPPAANRMGERRSIDKDFFSISIERHALNAEICISSHYKFCVAP